MFNNCQNLYAFIKAFDIEMSKDPDNMQLRVLFANIVVHLEGLIQQSHDGLKQNQKNTILSAKEFLIKQTEQNWDLFCTNSTNSYPFGPGDGCYCVEETGVLACHSGSGCFSGIGCLAFLGLPEDEVWTLIAEILKKSD